MRDSGDFVTRDGGMDTTRQSSLFQFGPSAGPSAPPTPKWKRELRLLRRDGLFKYVRVLRKLRRFERSVRRLP